MASVYHKPAETFIGRGRIGADGVAKGGPEYVSFISFSCIIDRVTHADYDRLTDDRATARKALQTVAQGQQAENLLNFDDPTSSNDGQQPTGLAATTVLDSTPAAANLLSGTSSNPLDDLVSIFGNTGIGSGAPPPAPGQPQTQTHLNVLGGLSFGAQPMSPAPPVTPSVLQAVSPIPPTQPQQQQAAEDDLLGLF